jgi:cyclopropane fatty-acyl-phospholipid synthase-like methyltransferase
MAVSPLKDYPPTIMSRPINMHAARTAMNQDPKVREWAEQFLKNRERIGKESMTDEEFDKHWRYVKPERMHEGAIEAVTAYMEAQQSNQ